MNIMSRIMAWITIIIMVGLVITTFVLGIMGSSYAIPMVGVTMGVSIVLWVILWFMKLVVDRNNREMENASSKEEPDNQE